MSASSLRYHTEITHVRSLSNTWEVYTRGGETIVVSLPNVLTSVACTVEGCLVRAHTLGRLWENFIHGHWKA